MSVINTNVKALAAQESMRSSNLSMSQAMERLSTGKKINSAKDDAAGLAITNRMTSQIRGIAKAIGNTNDAISMSQTAEGALGNVSDILQRMRELAVQSGSGTLNGTDRSSLQLEVSQLKQQIEDIASRTNHNNIKLLDGSAKNITIQTGVNSGDTMSVGFDSIKTKDIGIGSKATLMSVGGEYSSGGTFEALTASSLYLNGVAVGASLAAEDNASFTEGAASAIAKASAINKVSALSGVYAKAESTFVSGAVMTAATAVSSGTLTINGVTTDTFANSTDTSLTRKAVVNAINAKSSITGVVAVDTGDDNLGVSLKATDGRNITLEVNTFADSATLGLKNSAETTYVGSYSLYTLDGRDINVGSKAGAQSTELSSGLRTGTYKSDSATFVSFARDSVTAAPSITSTGILTSSTMVINGVQIGAALSTDDTASYIGSSSTRSASAIAIAAAINRSSAQTGVTATASPNVVRGNSDTDFTASTSATTATIFINGTKITANMTSINGVIDSINSKSSLTGVVASQWGSGLQLTAADGRNIALGTSADAVNWGLGGLTIGSSSDGTAAATFYGSVQLSSDNAFSVKAGVGGITNLENLGFREGTFGGSDNGLKINQIDVSTVSGSSQAIVAIDAAINTVSSMQAMSGAFNNRLDSVINNLTESNQNMQASRSRILDTDYASETTSLAKQQIIQQAATAMLAQANQSSQSILSLLK